MAAVNIRTLAPVPARWDAAKHCWRVEMPGGKVLLALDEQMAVRLASGWVGTYQPVRFLDERIEYRKAGE